MTCTSKDTWKLPYLVTVSPQEFGLFRAHAETKTLYGLFFNFLLPSKYFSRFLSFGFRSILGRHGEGEGGGRGLLHS